MDPNGQQQAVSQPVPQQEIHQEVAHSPLSKAFWIALGIIIVLGLIGGAYYLGTQKNNNVSNGKSSMMNVAKNISPTSMDNTRIPTNVPTVSTDATTNWKIYTSTAEKASFKYPPDWIVTKPAIQTNYPDADQVGIQSPSGAIKVSWVSALSGFGGGCSSTAPLGSTGSSMAPCPLITIIDKTPIKNTNNLFVVSGTTTRDGQTYEPFLAVQDTGTGELLTTQRSMGYDMYTGRNNGSLPENRERNVNVLLSTGDAYAKGPSLTSEQAKTWFNNPEVQQAKQILLSLTY